MMLAKTFLATTLMLLTACPLLAQDQPGVVLQPSVRLAQASVGKHYKEGLNLGSVYLTLPLFLQRSDKDCPA